MTNFWSIPILKSPLRHCLYWDTWIVASNCICRKTNNTFRYCWNFKNPFIVVMVKLNISVDLCKVTKYEIMDNFISFTFMLQFFRNLIFELFVCVVFESGNPPIPSTHDSTIIMSNFSAYKHKLKKFHHWPHSQVTLCEVKLKS